MGSLARATSASHATKFSLSFHLFSKWSSDLASQYQNQLCPRRVAVFLLTWAMLPDRFRWAEIALRVLECIFGSALSRSALFQTHGTDTDFSGGACSWEHASEFLEAAGLRKGPVPWQLSLKPKTTCAAQLVLLTAFPNNVVCFARMVT